MGMILLVPIASIMNECVRDAMANALSTASCYPPVGWVLFLGCLLWAAVNTGAVGFFLYNAWDAERKNAKRPRILRQMTRAGGRP